MFDELIEVKRQIPKVLQCNVEAYLVSKRASMMDLFCKYI